MEAVHEEYVARRARMARTTEPAMPEPMPAFIRRPKRISAGYSRVEIFLRLHAPAPRDYLGLAILVLLLALVRVAL